MRRAGAGSAQLLAMIAALGVFATNSQAIVIYVDDTAPPTGANDGTSWENAFLDLQDGLKAAQAGDEVRIAQGLYKPAPPNGSREASFNVPNGVIMQGGYAGYGASNPDELDFKAFVTTLSGDLNGNDGPNFANYTENSYHVLTVSGADSTTQIRGVTIRGGSADYPDFNGGDPRTYGGALIGLNAATPAIFDSVFRENRALSSGGAISAEGIHLERCSFMNNQGIDIAGGAAGGAVRVGLLPSMILECTFKSNWAANSGGAIIRDWSETAPLLRIERCSFVDNFSPEAAGAIAASHLVCIETDFIGNVGVHGHGAVVGSECTFVNCRFLGNGAACYFSAAGSALTIWGSASILNCSFSGNNGSFSTIYVTSDTSDAVLIANCTIVGSDSGCQGAAIRAGQSTAIANCILWNNSYDSNDAQSGQIVAEPTTTIANNIIQGWDGTLGGVNNSGDDPLFIDADGPDNDYGTEDDNPRLNANSPAINAGDNSYLPLDEFDLDQDGDTSETIPLDLDALPRIVDGIVDLGPYEYPDPVDTCPADIAPPGGNGTINVDDLLLVINAWGPCPDCPADVTDNGIVDVDDLLMVINNWGDCP